MYGDTFQSKTIGNYGEVIGTGAPSPVNLTYPIGLPDNAQGFFQIDSDPTWNPIPIQGLSMPLQDGQILRIKAEWNGQEDNDCQLGQKSNDKDAKFIFTWADPNLPRVTVEVKESPTMG